MPLLRLGNRRTQQGGNDGGVGKLDYRIGNTNVGQGVFLTGAAENIPTEHVPTPYNPAGLKHVVSGGTVTSFVLLGSTGQLFRFMYYNGNAATRYLQMFNAKTLPANGAVPYAPPIAVLTGQTVSIDYGPLGMPFPTGIVLANSTTAVTLTIGSADGMFSGDVF